MDNLNLLVAKIFRQIARILELKNDNLFRIRAYLRAADTIEPLGETLQTLVNEDELDTIPGIGKDLAEKIKEIAQKGKLKFFEDLKKAIPEGVLTMLDIPGLGPKTVSILYNKLHIKNIEELERAAKSGKLLTLQGIKEKTVSNILAGIKITQKGQERISLGKAYSVAQGFLASLEGLKGLKKIICAGSLRRMKETVRDIDILAISDDSKNIIEKFIKAGEAQRVLAQGDTKASILTGENIQVDLRVVSPKSFGAALLYFTGSKDFNIKLRQMALKKNLKVNEYGVFSVKAGKEKFLAGKTEEGIFDILGLKFIEPELRENRGEIELALKGTLPKLIKLSDIKGDLHVHSNYSDGANSITEMAQAAKLKGYEYVAITDHSESLKVARGLSREDLKRKKKEVDVLNKKLSPFRILYGVEVDVDSEGNLDYPDKILAEFDVVVAAIHLGFKQSREQLTRRLVNACQSGRVNIISHPTGKLWGVREPYPLDLDEVSKAARDNNIALEINSFPDRLDLNDINTRQVKESGGRICINTDSHKLEQLDYMIFGVATARRGWIEKNDCLNTLGLSQLLKFLKK